MFGQESFAELAWKVSNDSRSLALLREAMSEIEQRKRRGGRLRKLRKDRQLPTWLLAQRAGLGVQAARSIENWEKGAGNPREGEKTWKALAKALKVSYNFLYWGEEVGPPAEQKDIWARLNQIEAKLDSLLEEPEAERAAEAVADVGQESAQAQPQRAQRRAATARKGKGAGAES